MLQLVRTCEACPEQYDVYLKGREVAYMRLRHGRFRVTSPDLSELIYEAYPEGDGLFTTEERDGYLNEACKAILVWLGEMEKRAASKLFQVVQEDDLLRL